MFQRVCERFLQPLLSPEHQIRKYLGGGVSIGKLMFYRLSETSF
jgi:hypothetical protein